MQHTLIQLQQGQLHGTRRLNLAEDLEQFPVEILSLADSLEILDLSNNRLSSLPDELQQLTQLKILFASNNNFTELPAVLGRLPKLEIIGFKSNQIRHVPEQALPAQLRWLILTDNQIEILPDSLGRRPRLQKLALAGNRLRSLPATMADCQQLELIRISANQLTECPAHILALPKLRWLAFAGNPFCAEPTQHSSVPVLRAESFTLQEVLGQGASGVISLASWCEPQADLPEAIAVKVFKGDVTSDGYPANELHACLRAGQHPNLVSTIAQVNQPDCLALVMKLIPPNYRNLGLPPSLDSCTRDTFPPGFSLSLAQITKMLAQMQQVFEHLHARQICHGDLYAHNTLFDDEANIMVGDFGAASVYSMLSAQQQAKVREIEGRALACFADDLLSVCAAKERDTQPFKALQQRYALTC